MSKLLNKIKDNLEKRFILEAEGINENRDSVFKLFLKIHSIVNNLIDDTIYNIKREYKDSKIGFVNVNYDFYNSKNDPKKCYLYFFINNNNYDIPLCRVNLSKENNGDDSNFLEIIRSDHHNFEHEELSTLKFELGINGFKNIKTFEIKWSDLIKDIFRKNRFLDKNGRLKNYDIFFKTKFMQFLKVYDDIITSLLFATISFNLKDKNVKNLHLPTVWWTLKKTIDKNYTSERYNIKTIMDYYLCNPDDEFKQYGLSNNEYPLNELSKVNYGGDYLVGYLSYYQYLIEKYTGKSITPEIMKEKIISYYKSIRKESNEKIHCYEIKVSDISETLDKRLYSHFLSFKKSFQQKGIGEYDIPLCVYANSFFNIKSNIEISDLINENINIKENQTNFNINKEVNAGYSFYKNLDLKFMLLRYVISLMNE